MLVSPQANKKGAANKQNILTRSENVGENFFLIVMTFATYSYVWLNKVW